MATLIPPPSKKAKLAEKRAVQEASTSTSSTPAPNVIVQFKAARNDAAATRDENIGNPIRLPSDTNRHGLELLVNQLTKAQKALSKDDYDEDNDDDDEPTPFSFHVSITKTSTNDKGETVTTVERVPVLKDLNELLKKPDQYHLSVEDVIQVICEPEAVFKVRQITRCSSTLSGEFSTYYVHRHAGQSVHRWLTRCATHCRSATFPYCQATAHPSCAHPSLRLARCWPPVRETTPSGCGTSTRSFQRPL